MAWWPSAGAPSGKPDPDRLWANAAFLDGHVEFVNVFAYDARFGGVQTPPGADHPYY